MTSTLVHSAGSSGFLATPFPVFSTSELASLVNFGYVVSSSSFKQSNTLSAIQGSVYFLNTSTAGVQQAVGANFCGWFLRSDASGNFEAFSTVAGVPRPPDFIIPLPSTTITLSTSGIYCSAGYPPLPWENFKVLFQNNSGATLGSTCGQLFIGPLADDAI